MAGNSNNDDRVKITVMIPRTQHTRLKLISAHEGRSITDLVRQQIGELLRERFPEPVWTMAVAGGDNGKEKEEI